MSVWYPKLIRGIVVFLCVSLSNVTIVRAFQSSSTLSLSSSSFESLVHVHPSNHRHRIPNCPLRSFMYSKRTLSLYSTLRPEDEREEYGELSHRCHYHDEKDMNDDSVRKTDNIDVGTSMRQEVYMKGVGERENQVSGYSAEERLGTKGTREVMLSEPRGPEKEYSVSSILKELAAIQQQGPQKYCMLGTRHCSYLHQQIIELLAYALVLSGNHVFTSGAGGTHSAAIKGALRAERPDLLTVVLPQSLSKQPEESQKILEEVVDIIEMPQNDKLSLDVASRMCNSFMLSRTDQLIAFAFHESTTVIEATREAKKLEMLVTTLFLD